MVNVTEPLAANICAADFDRSELQLLTNALPLGAVVSSLPTTLLTFCGQAEVSALAGLAGMKKDALQTNNTSKVSAKTFLGIGHFVTVADIGCCLLSAAFAATKVTT